MIFFGEKRRFTFTNFLHLFIQGAPVTHSAMCYAKQLKSLVEFPVLQTQFELLHSADQASIVIEGVAVTGKPIEETGKVRAMHQQ